MRQLLRSSAVLLAATIGGSAIAADPAVDADRQPKTDPASTELPTIYVIGLTPTAGAEGDLRRYPGNAQVFGSDDMRDQQSRNLSRYLADNANGLHLADAANNPFQADLFYRGYSVSPLLGLPQGLAVYQDGVRINEIFGDTVNWDLVPDDAIDRIELIPGANPVFGQNTLGGAISVRTKTGWDQPGWQAEAGAGSFGRISSSLGYGVAGEDTALYTLLQTEDENGWRDYSQSRLRQLFTRASIGRGDSGADLSITAADNSLRGNGAVPIELLDAEGRDAVFTHPDITEPQMLFVNLQWRHRISEASTLSGGVYWRRNDSRSFNGDGTEFAACADPANVDANGAPLLCEFEDDGDEEEVVVDQNSTPVTASEANDSATENSSRTRQTGRGLSLQWAHEQPLLGRPNRRYVGISVDDGFTRFRSQTELAQLSDDRGTTGSGIVVGESLVGLHAANRNLGVFVSDIWQATERLSITAAGRYQRAEVQLRDQGLDDDLDGDHHFTRFNPLIGATFDLRPTLTLFGSVSEASRAPTPVELTCANPEAPCKLPNGFVDDPPLDQVITRNIEIGLRGGQRAFRWNGALYRGISRDDILFITDGRLTNQGYFSNVGDTLRQGAEINLDWAISTSLRLSVGYSWVDARFREDFLVNTPNHPLGNNEQTRQVRSGDRIPLVPQHLARANLGWTTDALYLGLGVTARSSSHYRGDEANVDDRRIGGFMLVNALGSYRVSRAVTLFARVDNLLDTDYATFGLYGEADEVLGDQYEDSNRFIGPGAPRAFHAGVRIALPAT